MSDQTLQEIKDRLNIVDVIGGYIQVRKAGTAYKALCPFHNEKTPSFQISPQKQIWHCFGCGEGGDVFTFVQKMENLEFRDVLKILADKAGVKLPEYRPQNKEQQDEKELLYRINDFAARFYHQVLVNSKLGAEGLEYLYKRGLTDGTIEKWQIGFAPVGFHILEQAMAKKNIKPEELVKAGLSVKNERGQVYDRFRGRVMFPIYNYLGQAVGFSARILPKLDDGKTGKYINSPETAVYNKSQIMFGLNFAKDAIRKKDEAVIVEGQMDCIAAHQAGFANTVASSGTALTQQHLAVLSRLTKNLKFCFDGDKAGQAASRRAGELALKAGFRIKVITLTAAKDPDELIKKSPGLWEKAVSEAVWFLDYYISQAERVDADPVAQKHYLSSEVVPFLSFISDSLEQDHYINEMVKKFGISEKAIRSQLKGKGAIVEAAEEVKSEAGQGVNLEKHILGGLLVLPKFLQNVQELVEPEDFTSPEIKVLISTVKTSGIQSGEISESVLAKEASFMVESELESLSEGSEALLRDLEKDFALLKLQGIKRRQVELSGLIRLAETKKDTVQLQSLSRQFAELSILRTNLEKKL